MSLPTESEFSLFVTEKRLWPHCLRVIATTVLLMPKAPKFINGRNLNVLTSHDVSGILDSKVQSNNGSIFKAAVNSRSVESSRNRASLTLFLETPIFRKG